MPRILVMLLVLSVQPALAGPDAGPWEDMPPGEGRRETYAICSACHSMQLVEQQGMTRGQWDETLTYMVEEQGMAPLERTLLDRILDYLAMAYSPDRPNWNPEYSG
jgi:cytochrome c